MVADNEAEKRRRARVAEAKAKRLCICCGRDARWARVAVAIPLKQNDVRAIICDACIDLMHEIVSERRHTEATLWAGVDRDEWLAEFWAEPPYRPF